MTDRPLCMTYKPLCMTDRPLHDIRVCDHEIHEINVDHGLIYLQTYRSMIDTACQLCQIFLMSDLPHYVP